MSLPPFVAVSDNVAIFVATGIFAFLTSLLQTLNLYFTKRLERGQEAAAKTAAVAAEKSEEVKSVLQQTTADRNTRLETLTNITREVHALNNGGMAAQLETTKRIARRLADVTKDPGDIAAADRAELAYTDHMAKQAAAYAQRAGPAGEPMPTPTTSAANPGADSIAPTVP